LALLVLLVVGILFGLGFVVVWLFVAAGIVLLAWLAGWAVRRDGGRWYYW
jgi:hypothetical protein